jgi:hypothetical protein
MWALTAPSVTISDAALPLLSLQAAASTATDTKHEVKIRLLSHIYITVSINRRHALQHHRSTSVCCCEEADLQLNSMPLCTVASCCPIYHLLHYCVCRQLPLHVSTLDSLFY